MKANLRPCFPTSDKACSFLLSLGKVQMSWDGTCELAWLEPSNFVPDNLAQLATATYSLHQFVSSKRHSQDLKINSQELRFLCKQVIPLTAEGYCILFSDLVLMPSCSRQVCTAEILFIWSMRSHGHVKQWSKYMRNITMPTQKVQSNMHLLEMPLLCPQLRMQLAYVKNSNGMCLDQVWDKGYEKMDINPVPLLKDAGRLTCVF